MRNLLMLFVSMAFTVCFSQLNLTAAASQGNADAGQTLHKQFCIRCHGEQGKGDGAAAKVLKTKPGDWSDGEKMSKQTDEELFKLIQMGGDSSGRSKLMPAFESKLKEAQINDLVAFIRSLQEP